MFGEDEFLGLHTQMTWLFYYNNDKFSMSNCSLYLLQICEKVKSEMTTAFDNDRKVPYSCSQTRKEWVGYDNEKSLEEKVRTLYSDEIILDHRERSQR